MGSVDSEALGALIAHRQEMSTIYYLVIKMILLLFTSQDEKLSLLLL